MGRRFKGGGRSVGFRAEEHVVAILDKISERENRDRADVIRYLAARGLEMYLKDGILFAAGQVRDFKDVTLDEIEKVKSQLIKAGEDKSQAEYRPAPHPRIRASSR